MDSLLVTKTWQVLQQQQQKIRMKHDAILLNDSIVSYFLCKSENFPLIHTTMLSVHFEIFFVKGLIGGGGEAEILIQHKHTTQH